MDANPITTITVTTNSAEGLDVDTPFRVEGVTGYNGQFVVTEKPDDNSFQYLN